MEKSGKFLEKYLEILGKKNSLSSFIGRPTLNSWRAATYTYHLFVKFPIEYGIGEVQGDQLTTKECYLAMLAMNEQM